MKRIILLFGFLVLVGVKGYGQGITVITHGFRWGSVTDDVPEWVLEQARAIKERAGGGIIYKNNPLTGLWEIEEDGDASKEIILCYNWVFASGRVKITNPNSYLGNVSASADHLFALLHNIPNKPIDFIKNLPKHFIGHSRGAVVLIELSNHFLKKYPTMPIEHLTTLDPHPAIQMGDVYLSYVESDGDRFKLRIPANVVKADNYYRTDAEYEAESNLTIDFAAFDGVPVIGAQTIRLNNDVIDSWFPNQGGAHSKVHAWYYFTENLEQNPTYDGSGMPNNWYNNSDYYYESSFGTETRHQAGFNHSRIGGGYNALQSVPESFKINTYFNPPTIFNGDFLYKTVGWDYNSGQGAEIADDIIIENEKLILKFKKSAASLVGRTVRHANFLFPSNENSLSFNATVELNNATVYPTLIIRFFNTDGSEISEIEKRVNNQDSFFNLEIPSVLQGKFGTFEVEFKSNEIAYNYYEEGTKIILDNFDLVDFVFSVSAPTITASKTNISSGQSVLLTATGCENGTIHWSNEQSGTALLHGSQ